MGIEFSKIKLLKIFLFLCLLITLHTNVFNQSYFTDSIKSFANVKTTKYT